MQFYTDSLSVTLHRFPLSTYEKNSSKLPQESPTQFPRKVGIHLPNQSSYPQRSLSTLPTQKRYPQQTIINNSAKHLYPHRVSLPSMVARVHFSPQSYSIRQVYSLTELSSPIGILATIIPSGSKSLFFNISPGVTSRHPSRIHFPRRKKYIHKHHIFIHMCVMSYNLIYVVA